MEFVANEEKKVEIETSTGTYLRHAIQTHFVGVGESYIDLIEKYVKPVYQEGDIVSASEKVIALCQKRIVTEEECKPGFWAKFLCRFVHQTAAGPGMGLPVKMQFAINTCGVGKVIWAAICAGFGKLVGKKGVFYDMLGEEVKGLDGFYGRDIPEYEHMGVRVPENPGAVCDEIASWKTDGPYNDIKQGMSARSQPLMFEITTAGFVRNSIYDTQYAYASRWLNGELDDDRFIPFIWELDRDDDWMHDEDCWVKANPGLGTIKSIDTLRGFVQRAINEPTFRPTVLTKDFNIPQNSSSAWLTWEESGSDEKVDFESMGFRYAIVGFDYAQSVDLTCAQVLCMRDGDEKFYERSMYWIPEAKLEEQETKGGHDTKDHAPYRLWIDQGYMRVVQGNVVPVSVLAQFIQELRDEHGIYTFALGYDPWHVIGSDRDLLEQMIGQDRCEAVIQGAKTLSDPMNRIRADYRRGRFVDNANPVNRWCRMNVMVRQDGNGTRQRARRFL